MSVSKTEGQARVPGCFFPDAVRLMTPGGPRHMLAAAMLCQMSVFAPAGDVEFSDVEKQRIMRHSPLPALPPDETNEVADDPRAAHLGQFLFFDKRLSANQAVSCATCHDPGRSFTDGRSIAEGIAKGERHTPTLWNVAYNRWQFWDGRADSLWAQAIHPIERPDELGSSRAQIAHFLYRDVELRAAYERIFARLPAFDDTKRFPAIARPVADKPEDPANVAWQAMAEPDRDAVNRVIANVGKAIAAYERKLVSRDSPFDRFARALRENDQRGIEAYPDAAKRGAKLFVGRGNCRFCHVGPNFTDGEFHTTRVAPLGGGPARDSARYAGVSIVKADPFNALGAYSGKRNGAAAEKLETLANKPDNWGLFKTPTLRNIAKTAPYMHEGQIATLPEVLRFYSTFEGALPPDHHSRETILQPLKLSEDETRDLIAFLESLTDTNIPAALLEQPKQPNLRE